MSKSALPLEEGCLRFTGKLTETAHHYDQVFLNH